MNDDPVLPEPAAPEAAPAPTGPRTPSTLGRLASFRFTYLAVLVFVLGYVFTVAGFEHFLGGHFRASVREAARVAPTEPHLVETIQRRVGQAVNRSPWVRIGDVEVRAIVLGSDGRTLIYAGGAPLPTPPGPEKRPSELLPAIVDVDVTVPHNGLLANGILVSFAAALLSALYAAARRAEHREQERLRAVVEARDGLVERSRHIERELETVRGRLAEVEPEKEIYAEEIHALEQERTTLLARLAEVEQREESLRARSSTARDLDQERRSLEELLDDAARELADKDEEIRRLQSQEPAAPRGSRAQREQEQLERRLRTLYKNLEIDDAALSSLVKLGDDRMVLRAEEALKRLSDEPDTAAIRRKVGGLPPHLSIFELGFARGGRIYYTRGRSRRFRVLLVGAKNSQKPDLEYLSRLPKEA